MHIPDAEIPMVMLVPPGTAPNYAKNNPVWTLVSQVEATELAAGREHYLADSLQYLFPIGDLALYGPGGDEWQVSDPREQNNKNDFQKQNVRTFSLAGISIVRGYARAGNWTGPFLHLSFDPPPGSPLNDGAHSRDAELRLYLEVGSVATASPLRVPYSEVTHRYEIELWGYQGDDLRAALEAKGQRALDSSQLQVRPDLVQGSFADFVGPSFDALRDQLKAEGRACELRDVAPSHAMHPVRPLLLEIAWASADLTVWDSKGGANYRYQFNMSVRGWRSYLAAGQSTSPHGGVGTLEFRNLYSNYFAHEDRRKAEIGGAWTPELGRRLESWNPDAMGRLPAAVPLEPFLAVDYMDLHILRPSSAIGIHRHRDNQEAFMVLQGKAIMITGDWCVWPDRDRAFELRTLQSGDLALVKGGQLHGLINSLDESLLLFMFGGYD